MAIKISKITGVEKGPKWDVIVDKYVEGIKKSSLTNIPLRRDIEKAQLGLVKAEDFLNALEVANSSDVSPKVLAQANLVGKTGGKGTALESGTRALWKNVNKATKDLMNATGQKWVVDHKHITPVNQRTTALMEALEMLKEEYRNSSSLERGRGGDFGKKLAGIGIIGDETAVIGELDRRIKHLKTARAYLKELENVLLDGTTIDEVSLGTAIAAGQGNHGFDITTDKINDAGVLDGDGKVGEFTVLTNEQHDPKNEFQKHMGFVISQIIDSNWTIPNTASTDDQIAADRLYKQITQDPTTIVGSEGIKNSIERQMHEIFEGKTPKKRKSRTKKTTRVKSKVDLRKSKAQLARLNAKKRQTNAVLKQSIAKQERQTRTQDVGGAEDAKSALHLKRLINQKLPAEVRRNMGRPALINRTGRFSNSVILESLTPSPAGMVGTYSYQYRPYETFENTGKRTWPASYNPKPLITKSIRNLAIQHMETKLTLRRT